MTEPQPPTNEDLQQKLKDARKHVKELKDAHADAADIEKATKLMQGIKDQLSALNVRSNDGGNSKKKAVKIEVKVPKVNPNRLKVTDRFREQLIRSLVIWRFAKRSFQPSLAFTSVTVQSQSIHQCLN
jgi:hypothetical protein